MSESERRFAKARAQVEKGRELRKKANDLREEGRSIKEIADILGIKESSVNRIADDPEISESELIWFPEVYAGRDYKPWTKTTGEISLDMLIALVRKRAKQDGEWAIKNGFVGDNEDKMRRMMAFVADEKNIKQCVEHILKEGMQDERTVDWVCRDLANASKVMVK